MIIKSGHHHLPLAHRLWAEEGACHRWLHPWPDTRFTEIMVRIFFVTGGLKLWGLLFCTLSWFLILPSKDHTLISHFGSTTDPKSESSIIPLPPVGKPHQIYLTKSWTNIFDQIFVTKCFGLTLVQSYLQWEEVQVQPETSGLVKVYQGGVPGCTLQCLGVPGRGFPGTQTKRLHHRGDNLTTTGQRVTCWAGHETSVAFLKISVGLPCLSVLQYAWCVHAWAPFSISCTRASWLGYKFTWCKL